MNTRSLRFQLGLWYAGLLTGVFVLLGAAMILVLKHYLESSVRDAQWRRARQIAQALSPSLIREGSARVSDEVESRFSPSLNNRFVRVRRADDSVLYRSTEPQDRTFAPETVPVFPWPERTEGSRIVRLPGGEQMLLASYALRRPDGTSVLIESGATLETVHAVLRHVLIVMAATLLVGVGVAVIGGFFLVRRALAVVDQISGTAERITLQNLSERLPVSATGDEIERLSVSLNRMIQRLDEAFLHSKRFVADASHELRTPLTVLRGELESLVEREQLQTATQERLGSLLEEVDRLTKVVEGLLTLSRLDAGEAKGEWLKLDLAELTVSTADQMSLLAEDKRITIDCHPSEPVFVEGDRTRLKQVVVNLLDNAIKYTADGGRVSLQVHGRDSRAILDVVDNGIGIAPNLLPHVFERFFRTDQARSRDVGGAGLGLAIVQAICLAHGGQVEVESLEGKGSRFRVVLPLAGAAGREVPPELLRPLAASLETETPPAKQSTSSTTKSFPQNRANHHDSHRFQPYGKPHA